MAVDLIHQPLLLTQLQALAKPVDGVECEVGVVGLVAGLRGRQRDAACCFGRMLTTLWSSLTHAHVLMQVFLFHYGILVLR